MTLPIYAHNRSSRDDYENAVSRMRSLPIKALVTGFSIVTLWSVLASYAQATELPALPFDGVYRCDTYNSEHPNLKEQLTIKWDMRMTTNPNRLLWSGPTGGSMNPDKIVMQYISGELLVDTERSHESVEVFLRSYFPLELEGFYVTPFGDSMTTFLIDSDSKYNSYTLGDWGRFRHKTGTCTLIEGQDWKWKLQP